MNMPARLQPLSIGDLFDAAFGIYRRHFLALITIAALSAVPMVILRYVRAWTDIFSISFGRYDIFGVYLTEFIIDSLLTLTLGSVLSGALTKFVSSTYLGAPIAALGAYRIGIGRYALLIVASAIPFAIKNVTRPIGLLLDSIWYGSGILFIFSSPPYQEDWYSALPVLLFCFASILALRVFILLLYAFFLLVPQVVVLERGGLLSSLRRSRELVHGSMRRALLIVIPAEILRLMFDAGLPTLLRMLPWNLLSYTSQWIVFGVASVSIQMLLQPLLIAIFTVFYYDQRVRNEGFDLELLVQQRLAA